MLNAKIKERTTRERSAIDKYSRFQLNDNKESVNIKLAGSPSKREDISQSDIKGYSTMEASENKQFRSQSVL